MKTKEDIDKDMLEYKEEWDWIASKLDIPPADLIQYYSEYNETVRFMREFHYDQNHSPIRN